MAVSLLGRSLLTLLDYSPDEILYLLKLAKKVKDESKSGKIKKRFEGKTLALLFEKRSTRTRCSFETAFGEEGGHPVFLSKEDIQLGGKETPEDTAQKNGFNKPLFQLGGKESLEDTARVLGRMFNAIQYRGFEQEIVETLAKYSGVPVYNGLTDLFHPTQALADIMTMQENFGEIKGRKLVFAGDGRNNVARSLMVICSKLGIHFTVITPAELNPDDALRRQCAPLAEASGAVITVTPNIDSVKDADALYTDVWASMGEESKKSERVRLLSPYQMNQGVMDKTGKKETIFLHCLPAVRGEEVTSDVIDGQQSRVWDQAENRKHTIKAVMLATIK